MRDADRASFGATSSQLLVQIYFWPTLPFTFGLRARNLWTKIDDTVIVGVAPVGLSVSPVNLRSMNVRGVINM